MVGRSPEQAEAALRQRGYSAARAAQLAPHLAMPGNRPSSTLVMDELSPATLGALLALYEHRTFCSAQLWGINAFDQWGVELGKEIGRGIYATLAEGASDEGLDSATRRLIDAYRAQRRH